MKTICIFGASIVCGLNDFENGGWCDMLKKDLMKSGGLIFNLGIWGDDTGDLLKRFDNECKARKPDIIIFALGGNDSQFLMDADCFRVDLETFKENWRKLVSQAQAYTKNIIFVGLTVVNEEKINNYYIPRKKKYYKNEVIKKYDLALCKIADEYGLKHIPMLDVLEADDLDDGLHPNSRGHEKIFNRLRESLIL